jgi:hypothetical protein
MSSFANQNDQISTNGQMNGMSTSNKTAGRRNELGVLRLWEAYGLIQDLPVRGLIVRALARLGAIRGQSGA